MPEHMKYVVKARWHFDGLTFACASHDHSCSIWKYDESSKSYKQLDKLLFSGNTESLAFSKVKLAKINVLIFLRLGN